MFCGCRYHLRVIKDRHHCSNENFSSKDIIEVYSSALRWKKSYDDCNPDVGLPPSLESLLEGILNETRVELTQEEKNAVLAKAKY